MDENINSIISNLQTNLNKISNDLNTSQDTKVNDDSNLDIYSKISDMMINSAKMKIYVYESVSIWINNINVFIDQQLSALTESTRKVVFEIVEARVKKDNIYEIEKVSPLSDDDIKIVYKIVNMIMENKYTCFKLFKLVKIHSEYVNDLYVSKNGSYKHKLRLIDKMQHEESECARKILELKLMVCDVNIIIKNADVKQSEWIVDNMINNYDFYSKNAFKEVVSTIRFKVMYVKYLIRLNKVLELQKDINNDLYVLENNKTFDDKLKLTDEEIKILEHSMNNKLVMQFLYKLKEFRCRIAIHNLDNISNLNKNNYKLLTNIILEFEKHYYPFNDFITKHNIYDADFIINKEAFKDICFLNHIFGDEHILQFDDVTNQINNRRIKLQI